MQSKKSSLVEASINTLLGFIISFCAWPFVAEAHGIQTTVQENFTITLMFTVISIARGYVVRRWFNARIHKFAEKVTK